MKKYLAEFIGTFVLVFVACGVAGQTGGSLGVTSVAFGLVIVAMAYSIGNVSGCHINPAVSIAMLCAKKMSLKDFIGYVVAQFLGAIAGAAVLMAVVGDSTKLGTNALYNGNAMASFIIEAVLTCIFVLAILGVTSKKEYGNVAGLVIGGALTLVHLLGINFTGTSVNPARSFGPALIAGSWDGLWVFILAPLVGGILAAVIYGFLAKED
ncbi:MAG: aquaporin [Clostridia bacterium]|nr:aquaporin [Clostridia bacterium]